MANKPLQSIKFPGLSDTYTVPQVDNTLAVTGAAADAKKVGDEISDLKDELSDVTNTQSISFTDKYYIATNKSVGQTVDLTPVSNNAFSYAIVNCTEGDIITLNAVGWTTGRLWVFLDSNNVVLSVSNASVTADGLAIIAPQDAAKCVINSYTQNLGVCYAGASIDYKISKNDDKIEFIDKSINKIIVNTDAIDVTNWAQGYINSQGGVSSDNKYVTSNNLFTFEDDVYITVAEGLSLVYGLYSGSSASDYDGNSSKVYVNGNECVIPYVSGKYYRFQLSKTDGTNLAKADVPTHALAHYYKVYTDTTLTKTGKSADAKVVGDSIAPQKALGAYNITDVTIVNAGTGFITTAGTINSNSDYKYTTPIAVSSGDVIELSAWGTSGVVILAKTNANADFYTTLMVGDVSADPKFYTVTFDGYVAVSYNNNNRTAYIKKHHATSITALANNYNSVDVTVKTNRFLSNPLVESMTHQGFSLGHGKNAMSSFWGGYLKGFDTMLCNIRWTADTTPIPVCEHDASFTDSVTGNTITIAETTYAELAETRRNGEVIPKFEDVVYMAKMLGMPVMSANVPGANETEKWNIIWGILDKYRMTNHMQWVATESTADVILAHNPNQTILFYLSTFSAENLNTLVTSVNSYADQHPDSKFVVWVPAAGANVETLKSALVTANLNLRTNVKMGLCNIETGNYIDLLPYVDVFHSDTIATGSMIPGIVAHLSQKYPQINPYITYNFVKNGR